MANDTFEAITADSFRSLIREVGPAVSRDLAERMVGQYSSRVVRQLLEYVSTMHADACARQDWPHADALGDLFEKIGR